MLHCISLHVIYIVCISQTFIFSTQVQKFNYLIPWPLKNLFVSHILYWLSGDHWASCATAWSHEATRDLSSASKYGSQTTCCHQSAPLIQQTALNLSNYCNSAPFAILSYFLLLLLLWFPQNACDSTTLAHIHTMSILLMYELTSIFIQSPFNSTLEYSALFNRFTFLSLGILQETSIKTPWRLEWSHPSWNSSNVECSGSYNYQVLICPDIFLFTLLPVSFSFTLWHKYLPSIYISTDVCFLKLEIAMIIVFREVWYHHN